MTRHLSSSRSKHTRTAAQVTRARVSISWITTYPSLLASGGGRLTSRAGYEAFRLNHQTEFLFPWDSGKTRRARIVPSHWSRFWSSYLAVPRRYFDLPDDVAWDYVIPLRQELDGYVIDCTDSRVTASDTAVVLYPSGVAVLLQFEIKTNLTLHEFAEAVNNLRFGNSWRVTGPIASRRPRLDGIADHIIAGVACWLTGRQGPLDGTRAGLSVVTPLEAKGAAADFDVDHAANVRPYVVGLATLQPSGNEAAGGLLDQNRQPRFGARLYIEDHGHTIWRPDAFLGGSKAQMALECLHRNHTELATHIAALAGVVSWANDQVGANVRIPVPVQALVQRAVLRLNQLYAGVSLSP